MKRYFKYLVKKNFSHWLMRNKTAPAVQITQNALALVLSKHPFRYNEVNFNVFTYTGEDGLLFNIICRLEDIPPRFIDIGSGDCIKSNCANLAVNHGWTGLFVDSDKHNISIGESFYNKLTLTKFNSPKFLNSFVTPAGVNVILKSFLIPPQTGLLSIDIDGDDYWIWDAITATSSWVVIIECTVEFGLKEVISPYSGNNGKREKNVLTGASIPALVNLGKTKGYSLVSANRLGYNLIFLRNDLLHKSGIAELNPRDIIK